MKSNKFKKIISKSLKITGYILLISPLVLLWFIHGSYERYFWIINMPYPFCNFGGGPFQLFMSLGLLIIGLVLIFLSRSINRR